jgi:L-seryl-tRNA(Ser) seleniumtransferase
LGPPLVADVGSGSLLPLGDEPRAQNAVRAGADLVVFSGDKLLGGPQAGIAVGSSQLVSAMRRHPLARALRTDKLCLAALEATLSAYLEGTAPEELPTLRMLHAPPSEVEERARELAQELARAVPDLDVDAAPSVARSGGGTLPTLEVPSVAGRIHEGRLWLDARTLLPGDEEAVVRAVRDACG